MESPPRGTLYLTVYTVFITYVIEAAQTKLPAHHKSTSKFPPQTIVSLGLSASAIAFSQGNKELAVSPATSGFTVSAARLHNQLFYRSMTLSNALGNETDYGTSPPKRSATVFL
ncbi:hypothetical protein J6590_101461 [Homalodisca vitripennis]|nr:hypothetical protein J6590_101461 [Homalodisca vitripennis]